MTLPSGIHLPETGIAEICRKYRIRELAVFGSAARGDSGHDSDIDILVELPPDSHQDSLKPHAPDSALRDALVVYAEER